MVHPEYGTYPVSIELKEAATRFALRQRARYVFSACHPTESSIHTALGFRAASAPTASRVWGARLPLVLDLADVDFLRQVRAPFADAADTLVGVGPARAVVRTGVQRRIHVPDGGMGGKRRRERKRAGGQPVEAGVERRHVWTRPWERARQA